MSEALIAYKSAITDRSFKDQMLILGITATDLKGRVLDIGSGVRERFSKSASDIGITVDSLNPRLSKHLDRILAQTIGAGIWQNRSIAALAQTLPFKDNSYDTVVSSYSVPFWIPDMALEDVFSEVQRVLKPGGNAYLGPVTPDQNETVMCTLENMEVIFSLRESMERGLSIIVISK